MSLAALTVRQLCIRTIYMAIGYLLVKFGVLTRSSSRDIAALLGFW